MFTVYYLHNTNDFPQAYGKPWRLAVLERHFESEDEFREEFIGEFGFFRGCEVYDPHVHTEEDVRKKDLVFMEKSQADSFLHLTGR